MASIALGLDTDADEINIIALTHEYPAVISQIIIGPFPISNTSVSLAQVQRNDILLVRRDVCSSIPTAPSNYTSWNSGQTYTTFISSSVEGSLMMVELDDTRIHSILQLANNSSLVLNASNLTYCDYNAVSWSVVVNVSDITPHAEVFTTGELGTDGIAGFLLPPSAVSHLFNASNSDNTGSVSVGGIYAHMIGVDHMFVASSDPTPMIVHSNPCGSDMVFQTAPGSPISVQNATNQILFVNATATIVNMPPPTIPLYGSGTATSITLPSFNTSTITYIQGCLNILPLSVDSMPPPSQWLNGVLSYFNVTLNEESPCALTTYQMSLLNLSAANVVAHDLGYNTVRNLLVWQGSAEVCCFLFSFTF